MKNKTTILVILISLILSCGIYFGIKVNQERGNQNSEVVILKDAIIDEIDYQSKKINIYVFWGNGCPHCEELFEFLESIKSEYGKYFNVYGFEIWHNKSNGEIMDQLKEKLGEKRGSRSVPYYIIENKSMLGFDESKKEEIKNLIIYQYKNLKKESRLKIN